MWVSLLLYWILTVSVGRSLSPPDNCDFTFVRTENGSLNGTFSSLNHPKKYPSNLQCLYNFVAPSNERVDITFHHFSLAGSGPKYCIDYIDVYSEIKSPEDIVDIVDQQLSGRFCGTISPHRIVSLYSTVVIVFHTRNNTLGGDGFTGEYRFIPNAKYAMGEAVGVCSHKVRSLTAPSQSGDILSPTYPGNYPANLECTYQLLGEKGQRIKLEFTDFDLFFVGQHCPYDYMVVYDGNNPTAPVIQRVCGMQQKLEIFSEKENLFILFKTSRPPTFEHHRGFKLRYTFSSEFVDIAKMTGSDGNIDHMRGTECDIRVRSGKETRHTITSPNYPHQYPLNRTCVYYLDGKQGPQELEKVNLTFESFAIASRLDGCDDASMTLYLGGQDHKSDEYDNRYCGDSGDFLTPKEFVSNGPRLVMVFRSATDLRAQGFRASVHFVTDFGIPGTPKQGSNVCEFEFNSADKKTGEFNSPRFPSNYPTKTECIYHFKGLENENVNISFEQFNLNPGLTKADNRRNLNFGCGDWLNISTVYPRGIPQNLWNTTSGSAEPIGRRGPVVVNNGRYCGADTPGPIASGFGSNQMRVVFHSDKEKVSTGFKAKYSFIRETPMFPSNGKCGGVITDNNNNKQGGGVLKYPEVSKYDRGLICNWLIQSPPGTQLVLQLYDKFDVEGTTLVDIKTGEIEKTDCGNAVFRVYLSPEAGIPEAEFCGTKLVPKYTEFKSISNQIRVNFMTGPPHGSDLQGFKLSWTIISKSPVCPESTMFQCTHNRFCINKNLRCNQAPNCGYRDTSDESNCDTGESKAFPTLLVVGSVCAALILLLAILICVLITRKRRRSRRSRAAKNLLAHPYPHQHQRQNHQGGRMVGDGVTYFHAFT